MTHIRYRIEKGFERFARLLFRNRLKTIALMTAGLLMLISQIPKIIIDTSTEGFLHEKDLALIAYNAFRDQFGRDEVVIVAIHPPEIFDRQFLKRLKTFHADLEDTVPHIDDITSMANARNTRGDKDGLIVEDLLERWPETDSELAALKERVMTNRLYRNLLISENGTYTTVIIKTLSHSAIGRGTDVLGGFAESAKKSEEQRPYLTDTENSEVVRAVEKIVGKYRAPDFQIHVAGSPVVTHFLKQSMMKDMRKFMILATVMVAGLLFIMFRRISGVLLPLTIVMLSLLSTVGLMAATGVPIKLPTQILPSFLLAVGVGTSVHVLTIFYHRFRQNGKKEEAISYAIGHSGLAIVMTNLTTACGLLSFSMADIAPIADLGRFAAFGVILAFLNTVILMPPLLALILLKPEPRTTGKKRNPALMDRFLRAVGRISTSRPRSILAVSAVLMLLSAAALTTIRFSHHPLAWFPKQTAIRTATETIDRELKGSISLELIIDTGRENGLYEPEFLNRLEAAVAFVETLRTGDIFAGKAWSLTSILKEIHQALNENRTEFYAVPQDRELIAQEFLLFENTGSDDLEDVVDSRFSRARFTIKVPFEDAVKYRPFFDAVSEHFKDQFPDAEITTTGMMALLFRTIYNVMISTAKSYGIALGVITGLMILLIGRVRIGLLSMIPNLAPILLTLGVIGLFSIPMDLFTMMVASIAIGLAVDDTIHFMHNFRRYYETGGDPKAAVQETLDTTGRAMLVTSIVLALGFFIYAFATMSNVVNFGLLTAFTILMALVADYFIAPALMVLANPIKRGG